MSEVTESGNSEFPSNGFCTCVNTDKPDINPNSERKLRILNTVARTEEYLRERRISELIQYLFTKLLSHTPENPLQYLENLFDDCMLYRAGHGLAPVIYEEG